MLPYSSESYFALLAQYYEALGWLAFLLIMAAVAAASLGMTLWPAVHRLALGALAAVWAGIGAAFHALHFSTLNFAAPVYAGLFVAQALLLTWAGPIRGRVRLDGLYGPRVLLGHLTLAIAIAGYPLADWLAGVSWDQVRLAGLAPAPSVLLTTALLTMAGEKASRLLGIIPLIWSLIGIATAWILSIHQDLALLGLAALLILWSWLPPRKLTDAPSIHFNDTH